MLLKILIKIILIILMCSNVFAQSLEGASDEALLPIYEELRKTNLKATNVQKWGYADDMTKIDGGDIYTGTIVVGAADLTLTDRLFDDSTKADDIQAWIHANDATKIDGGDIYTKSILAENIGAGNFEVIIGLSSQSAVRSTASSATYPYLQMGVNGLELKDSDTGGTYGTAVYSTNLYGYGALGWIFNSGIKIPIVILKEPNAGASDVADMRFFNRADDPGGLAAVGDVCVVNGVMKICTSAGTPGTFQQMGRW